MQTELSKLLGTEYPIMQGGMAWVAEYHLASAVSEAGGLGIIGAANAPAKWVRDQIRKTKERTKKPFGVNVMLMSPNAEEVAQVILEEEVPVVTTGAGNPEKYMELWKENDHESYRQWVHEKSMMERRIMKAFPMLMQHQGKEEKEDGKK